MLEDQDPDVNLTYCQDQEVSESDSTEIQVDPAGTISPKYHRICGKYYPKSSGNQLQMRLGDTYLLQVSFSSPPSNEQSTVGVG